MFLLYFIVNILVVYGLSSILDQFMVDSLATSFWFVLVLSIFNMTIIPIIKFFAFPVNFLTLGLFNTLLNLAVIGFTTNLIDGVTITGDRFSSLLVLVIIAVSLSVGHSLVARYFEDK